MNKPGIITRGVRLRMDALAELVADGASLGAAGEALNLTKGEVANAWRNVKAQLGAQAI
ncbi:DNA-binding CsgD family transcriptional regulator [Novosphingobium chloroacetimidivorans]|uniref:DNA-binding CsgD family transcriptional regulator n=1 Tax=Novosphingobium chloroacetimidivorans TaxID=1428314 RepID=A0A7W7K682_9SPHN|nr:hypothetical protein [Novosphingobium chloroacetimidivorans]MBB4856992.1 DNA-binding CsgD family transcriptional regulator [Novosphingobium chloroacetimidivorans]